MLIRNYAGLNATQLAAIEGELGGQRGLQDVISWGVNEASGATSPRVVAEVVVQDEYTHDAIVPWRDSLVLVYDTT
ncbi:MAG TPA: hypothetical protein VN256_19190 [Pyrinomonadaceae bacterium]|nr:hypothetical protein [Pyrinomonadaceae bacterium]